MEKMKDPVGTEKVVHGQRWGAVHNGYFSDPAIARPLIKAVTGVLAESPADVIADLGGGTGFMLSQLAQEEIGSALLVNINCSDAQLALVNQANISLVRSSIDEFRRTGVATRNQRLLLMMRSVLHYFGESGLQPLLRHLRSQMEPGEFFVHQSAVFDNEEDAVCLNTLYQQMRTQKWYPSTAEMETRLADSGWRVTGSVAAPALLLDSVDLGLRYALDAGDLARIRNAMIEKFGTTNRPFRLTSSGFCAELHYRIFTCAAS